VYVLRQNCRAAGWRWDTILKYYEIYGDVSMNLIISRNSVLVIIPTTLEVDEGKENEDLSRQKTVCGDRECFSRDRYISSTIGKACLQHYVSEEYF
jgi:hypothetical protein